MQIFFANGGNQTRAACAASECAIHYSIAFHQNSKSCYVKLKIKLVVNLLTSFQVLEELFPQGEVKKRIKMEKQLGETSIRTGLGSLPNDSDANIDAWLQQRMEPNYKYGHRSIGANAWFRLS